MKTYVKLLTLFVLLVLIVSCAPKPTAAPATAAPATAAPATAAPATAAPATAAPATEAPLSADEQWLKDNQLGKYFTLDQDWAAIEAAAKKEGKVTAYVSSSRIEDQMALWAKVYPDIVLDGYDAEEIATRMMEEHNSGNVIADVWFNGDMMSLYGELYPKGIILPFIPSEFASALPVTEAEPFAVQRYGGDVWFYNNEQNKTCPIKSWWEIVDGSYKNSVYYEDPLAEADKISLFVTTIKHGDEMAASYQDYFGKAWDTDADYDKATTLNAGWLWVKKFAKSSGLVVMPGGDEITEAMGTLGMKDPAGIGNNSYSKVRDTLKGEVAIWPCEGIKPALGTSGSTVLGIAANAPHPNAAKLYIRWTLTAEGSAPWNVLGDWPGRTDLPAPEGAPAFKDAGLWPDDGLLMYQIGSQVRDFWTVNALK